MMKFHLWRLYFLLNKRTINLFLGKMCGSHLPNRVGYIKPFIKYIDLEKDISNKKIIKSLVNDILLKNFTKLT